MFDAFPRRPEEELEFLDKYVHCAVGAFLSCALGRSVWDFSFLAWSTVNAAVVCPALEFAVPASAGSVMPPSLPLLRNAFITTACRAIHAGPVPMPWSTA